MIKGKTIPFMGVSILFMMVALLAGIFRLMGENGIGPLLLVPLYGLHPLLMVFGFIAGIIMTERIAGIELLPSSKDSRLSVSMIPFVLVGITVEAVGYGISSLVLRYAGALLISTGSILFLLLLASFYRKGRENLSITFMVLSAVSLLLSSVLSARELPAGNVGFVMLLLLFPIIFILGERVELTSLSSGRRPQRLRPTLIAISISLLLFAAGSTNGFSNSQLIYLPAFVLLAVVFGVFLKEELSSHPGVRGAMPLQRYVRLHVGAAYLWGFVGAVSGVMYGFTASFQFYDAFIHSLALGFIGLMFLAHGPIILPVVMGRTFAYDRLSTVPLFLLTTGILFRILGDYLSLVVQSQALLIVIALSGWVILAAVMAFFVEIFHGTSGGRSAPLFANRVA